MTDKKDTLLPKTEGEPKPAPKEEKKEAPTTLDAVKTNLMQQYRNMSAICTVCFFAAAQFLLLFISEPQ